MVGCRSGVATQLSARNRQMVSVHCVCHRLALASSQESSDVSYLKKFKDYLLTLYNYFHFSPVKSARLKLRSSGTTEHTSAEGNKSC